MNKLIKFIFAFSLILLLLPSQTQAARIFSSGMELNSVTAGVEFTGIQATPEVVSGIKRSGSYAMRIQNRTATVEQQFLSADGNGPIWMRAYIRIVGCPNAAGDILYLGNASGQRSASIELQTDCSLKAYTRTTQVLGGCCGGSSPALDILTWYRVELYARRIDASNFAVEARLDGTTFAITNTSTEANAFSYARWGLGGSATSVTFHMDDMALNDATGGRHNSFPEAGKIVHFRPQSAGDIDGCTLTGGSPGWRVISEITPNDATSYCEQDTSSPPPVDEISVNASSSATLGIGATDEVRMVQIGSRISAEDALGASATTLFVKSQANGTKATQNLTILTTSWFTHDDTTPRNYKLTSYTDPQNGGRWTPQLIDTMQFGARVADHNPDFYISTLWALVEYSDPLPPAPSTQAQVKISGFLTQIKGFLTQIVGCCAY